MAGLRGAKISITCLVLSAWSPNLRSLQIPIEKDNEFPPPTLLLLLCLLPPDSSWGCVGGWSRGGQGGILLMATGHCCHGDLLLLDPLSTLLFLGLSDMHPSSCARAMAFRGTGTGRIRNCSSLRILVLSINGLLFLIIYQLMLVVLILNVTSYHIYTVLSMCCV